MEIWREIGMKIARVDGQRGSSASVSQFGYRPICDAMQCYNLHFTLNSNNMT